MTERVLPKPRSTLFLEIIRKRDEQGVKRERLVEKPMAQDTVLPPASDIENVAILIRQLYYDQNLHKK